MLDKPIEEITEADLQKLIDEEYSERRTIEYKEALPEDNADGIKEFLADVSSFANLYGGHLIYGITDKRKDGQPSGEPEALVGIKLSNPQNETTKWEQRIIDCIEPKLPRFEIWPVSVCNEGKVAIVIRVHRSWGGPHMVTYRNTSRFYSRTSAGKYQMDVYEIRDAFLLSETGIDRIRAFREERLRNIKLNQGIIALREGAKLVMHLVPLEAFRIGRILDVEKAATSVSRIWPIGARHCAKRYNFHGLLCVGSYPTEAGDSSYTQVYRDGKIESVTTSAFGGPRSDPHLPVDFEERMFKGVERMRKFQQEMGILPPIFLSFDMLGFKDRKLIYPPMHGKYNGRENRIDRNNLELPQVVIASYDIPVEKILKESFDAIWNAADFPASPNYDDEGNWRRFDKRKGDG